MSLQEFENTPDSKTRRFIQMRSIMDIGMGILYVGISVMILFAEPLNISIDFLHSVPGKLLGGLAIVYGCWRIYRGIKKNYYK